MMFGVSDIRIDEVLHALAWRGNAQGDRKRQGAFKMFAQQLPAAHRLIIFHLASNDHARMGLGKQQSVWAVFLHDGIDHLGQFPFQSAAVIEQTARKGLLHIVHAKTEQAVSALQDRQLSMLQQRYQGGTIHCLPIADETKLAFQLCSPSFPFYRCIFAIQDHLDVFDEPFSARCVAFKIIHTAAAPCAAHCIHIVFIGTDDHVTSGTACLQMSQQRDPIPAAQPDIRNDEIMPIFTEVLHGLCLTVTVGNDIKLVLLPGDQIPIHRIHLFMLIHDHDAVH